MERPITSNSFSVRSHSLNWPSSRRSRITLRTIDSIRPGVGRDKERTAGAMGTGAPDIDLDATAVQFAGEQLFDLAFYNNLSTRDGSVVHLGDNLTGAGEGDDEQVTVDELAARSLMSPRTFARRFRAVTGTTPHQWLLGQRILFAQRLLEATDESIELIASRSGFGSAANLRHHFGREVSTSPLAYRRTFRSGAAAAS